MERIGISAALLTPFQASGGIDLPRLAAHALGVIAAGADGVTLFGTTGEGASVAMSERDAALAALRDAGVRRERIVVGVCACAVGDAAAQVAQGLTHGIERFLLLPPFYFPGPGEVGLRAWHEALLAATDARARLILYHIPQVTGVPLHPELVEALARAHPGRILAVKDSSGDWASAERLLGGGVLPVLVGDERLLHRAVAMGAAGSICGMANLRPGRMARILATGAEDADLSAEVSRIVAGPVIPSLRALMARATGDSAWEQPRPPLEPLGAVARATLLAAPDIGDAG